LPPTSSHITTIGVRRPGFGTAGKPFEVFTNHFACEIPETVIHHYDGNCLLFVATRFSDRAFSLLSCSWYVCSFILAFFSFLTIYHSYLPLRKNSPRTF
jgi:hypothetical protein